MLHRLLPPGNRAPVRTIAGLDALDARRQGARQGGARPSSSRGRVKEALSGSWLGHPLHPVLTDVTIGTFTSAVLLDWLGGRDVAARLAAADRPRAAQRRAGGRRPADSDWADTEVGERRRCGGSASCTPPPTPSRRRCSPPRGRPARRGADGRLLALAGGGRRSTAGGYLGGHLSFAEGVGVDQTVFEEAPGRLDRRARRERAERGQMRCVEADGTAVLVARSGGRAVRALEPLLAPRRPAARGRDAGRHRGLPVARERVRPARRRAGPRPRRLSAAGMGHARASGAHRSPPPVGFAPRARELLRPPPHRGPLIAAGAVVLAVGLAPAELRLRGDALAGRHLLIARLGRRASRSRSACRRRTRTAAAGLPVGAAGHRAAAALPGAAAARRRARRRPDRAASRRASSPGSRSLEAGVALYAALRRRSSDLPAARRDRRRRRAAQRRGSGCSRPARSPRRAGCCCWSRSRWC